METLSDRVRFTVRSNISDGAPLQKQPTTLTVISRCQAFSCSNWHLSLFPSVPYFPFFSPLMDPFYTFVCLTFFKFANIFLQKLESRLEVFCRKGVLGNFAKFKGNTCVRVHVLIKLQKRLWHWCFPANFVKFLRTPFLQITSGGCFWKLHCNASECI